MTNGTNDRVASEVADESVATVPTNEQPPVEPEVTPSPRPHPGWSMPKSPVTREHADKLGRLTLEAAATTAKFIGGAARYVARVVAQLWRAIGAVPPALKLFAAAGLLMLLGIAGSIALDTALGLLCTVVVIPACSITLGVLGHRWYTGLVNERTDRPSAEPAASDLQRSVEYVDKKLAVALNALGTEGHQQAVIALFQAKTAVELTLGTEQDTARYGDVALPIGIQSYRPRIQVGSKSLLQESNSLAAS